MSKAIKLSAALAVLLALLSGPAQAGIDDGRYTNQTPYADPAAVPPVMAAPAGYSMTFIETIGRHGSRSMTNDDAEQRALNVWRTARSRNALTTAGERFGAEVATFQKAELKIGYGKLTTLGKAEWQGIGQRTAENYKSFFEGLPPTAKIARVTSSVTRTKQSASYLRIGMNAVLEPDRTFLAMEEDNDRLRLTSGSTTAGRAAIARIKKTTGVRAAAKNVLGRMYTKKYVDSLSDPVAAAMDVYKLYCTGAAMNGLTRVTFDSYFALADARMLGFMKDAENFYRYGPGVSGQTNSYRQARPLLADFFARLDKRVGGGWTAAVFRLGHGETTMPFAALIKAPGSEKQVPEGSNYTRYDNPWRGHVAGLPAGSIEWVAYKKSGSPTLVTMRYNERPVQFRVSCTPTEPSGYFYTVTELKDCLL